MTTRFPSILPHQWNIAQDLAPALPKAPVENLPHVHRPASCKYLFRCARMIEKSSQPALIDRSTVIGSRKKVDSNNIGDNPQTNRKNCRQKFTLLDDGGNLLT